MACVCQADWESLCQGDWAKNMEMKGSLGRLPDSSTSGHSFVQNTFVLPFNPMFWLGTAVCVFIRRYFSSQIHDSTSKFPFFWKRGKNLLLILQLAGARSLWAEIAENLLGTLETIFNGRRHRNDFNILRSMGNSSPTITVSHLGGGMNRKKRIKKWKVANLRNIDFLRWNRGKKSLCRKFDLIWFWMAPQ